MDEMDKMDEMDVDEMSELTLDKLPEHILIKIFILLQNEDYGNFLKLTQVCSTFNNIISSSSRLLSPYTIQMNIENRNLEWIGSRIYPRFEVNYEMIDRFLDILPVHGKFIKYLFIDIEKCPLVKIWKLRKAFSACSNLKDVIFTDNSCTRYYEDYVKSFPLMIALDELQFDGGPECFKIFENCTTKTFNTYFKQHNPVQMLEIFQKFMKQQNNLKTLSLMNDDRVNLNMFNNDELDHVNFRLTSFSLSGFEGIKKSKKFNTFISQHRDTLEEFTFQHSNSDLLPDFSNFKMLKSLILNNTDLPYELNLVLNSVENVKLLATTGHFQGFFPKLKHLSIEECKETCIEILSNNFPHLESIEMNGCEGNFLLCPPPSLKKMVFSHFDFDNVLFDFRSHKIEEIELKLSGNIFWLIEFLDCENTNVVKLTLRQVYMSTVTIKAIERNQHKISQLKIENCSVDTFNTEDCCVDLNFDTDDDEEIQYAASGPHYILDINGELIKGDKDEFDYEW